VHRSSGTDDTDNIYVGTNCKSDFGDLRVVKTNYISTLLPYWVEVVDTTLAYLWISLGTIQPGTMTFSVLYGNSTATTTGDITTIPAFTFGDDFNGTAVNTSKWTVLDGSQYSYQNTITVGNSVVNIIGNANDFSRTYRSLTAKAAWPNSKIRIKFTHSDLRDTNYSDWTSVGHGWFKIDTHYGHIVYSNNYGNEANQWGTTLNTNPLPYSTDLTYLYTDGPAPIPWQIAEFDVRGATNEINFHNETLGATHTYSGTVTNTLFQMGSEKWSNWCSPLTLSVDWVYVLADSYDPAGTTRSWVERRIGVLTYNPAAQQKTNANVVFTLGSDLYDIIDIDPGDGAGGASGASRTYQYPACGRFIPKVCLGATTMIYWGVHPQHSILIKDLPILSFTDDVVGGYIPKTVNFTNTSNVHEARAVDSYTWDFGYSDTDHLNNNSRTFNDTRYAMEFNVTLNGENIAGATSVTHTYTFEYLKPLSTQVRAIIASNVLSKVVKLNEWGKCVLDSGVDEMGAFINGVVDDMGKINWPASFPVFGGPIGKVVELFTFIHSRVRRR
jgi:hypothetical protein